MKRKVSISLAGLLLILSILACSVTINNPVGEADVRGSGTVVTENRALGDISGVVLATTGTLQITMGTSEALTIEAEDNLLPYIQTDVKGDTLVIETRPGTDLQATRPINYYLTMDRLDTITISSSGDVEVGDLQTNALSVTISSSGDCTISSLNGTSLQVRISSSGNLEILAGQVEKQTINISSSGELDTKNMASRDAEITISSSGDASVQVSDYLSGRLSSSGNIYYIGNPQVNVSTTSSGRVVQTSK